MQFTATTLAAFIIFTAKSTVTALPRPLPNSLEFNNGMYTPIAQPPVTTPTSTATFTSPSNNLAPAPLPTDLVVPGTNLWDKGAPIIQPPISIPSSPSTSTSPTSTTATATSSPSALPSISFHALPQDPANPYEMVSSAILPPACLPGATGTDLSDLPKFCADWFR
ncbi:hypothetical protein G7Y89_g15597 [Cudoniella acicularis]|uniref:Uncharacterized protein n=1 Tax=Cudoniella acicularis TaxID=354080 RepID=A0A8H4VJU9_9HELO|nr:hypothetical protein G7Y89_g15597 [Cudoniella acicularis]